MERVNSTNSVESEGTTFTPGILPVGVRPAKRGSASKLGEWQSFFLGRLEFLLNRQHEGGEIDPAMAALLSKAVYSTYLDCQAQGVGERAAEVLAVHAGSRPSAN